MKKSIFKELFNKKVNYYGEPIEYRMYSIVLTALNPMQKGIQAMHSVIEYSTMFNNNDEYKKWSEIDKTAIILEGGTYFDIKDAINMLSECEQKFSLFCEPDLNNIITSISMVVPSTIYDYPFDELEELIEDPDIDEFDKKCVRVSLFLKSKRLAR